MCVCVCVRSARVPYDHVCFWSRARTAHAHNWVKTRARARSSHARTHKYRMCACECVGCACRVCAFSVCIALGARVRESVSAAFLGPGLSDMCVCVFERRQTHICRHTYTIYIQCFHSHIARPHHCVGMLSGRFRVALECNKRFNYIFVKENMRVLIVYRMY